MPTALPPLALEEVTQSAEDPFAALNSMLSECWVSRPCKSFAVMGLRARSFRQSTRRRARTDLLVLVYDRCACRCTGLPASRCRFALACESGRNCAETWLCRDPARHDKLPSARLLQAPRVHRIWPHRRICRYKVGARFAEPQPQGADNLAGDRPFRPPQRSCASVNL